MSIASPGRSSSSTARPPGGMPRRSPWQTEPPRCSLRSRRRCRSRSVAELAAASEVPIVVHRARLRDDLVAVAIEQRAGVAPRVVVAECRAAVRELPAMVRDAVGWMRVLADEPLVVASTSVGSGTGDGAPARPRRRSRGRLAGRRRDRARGDGAPRAGPGRGDHRGRDRRAARPRPSSPRARSRGASWPRPDSSPANARHCAAPSSWWRRGASSRDLDHLLHDAEAATAVLGAERSTPQSLVDIRLKNV